MDNRNQFRLNKNNLLSLVVFHEARHAWHQSERARPVGKNDDHPENPRNDSDLDLLLEVVSLPSAEPYLSEKAHGKGDKLKDEVVDTNGNPIPAGLFYGETDAINFHTTYGNLCH
jgi:hypothetical protein